ncbi:TldD/PmbA family protein [Rivibacter subsaxonicus]|uniref:Putative Zn-dependent protease n=1 Tax=Rivibacter subsaxonicus TaxID=457575 RepID=A0A4Q7VCU2_9BURK|nr:metallopeptidase TldD-related protein [Rivibacter subsaxonicus]RZT93697.1 putative Zn-dependent protease [Rivibacter subsaxonicus]
MDAALNMNSRSYTEAARFEALADALLRTDPAVDRTSLYLRAEASDFLRFNKAALRQATSVQQAYVTIAVERGLRRAESTLTLGGEPALDAQRLQAERSLLVGQLDLISDDPWLLRPQAATHSTRDDRGALPEASHVIALVHELAGVRLKQDLVGFYAGGPVVHAFADSLGSRHWHRVESFHFDWCLYHRADKAVKTAYAGTRWDDTAFAARLDEAARRVPLLERDAHTLQPGAYRAAFSPSAMVELLGTLGWSGFSLKSRRTGVSSLMRLERGEAAFDARINLDEAIADGTAPCFTAEGFVRPGRVALVESGRLPAGGGTLNSPRSAAEYGVAANGAGAQESPEALRLGAGTVPHGDLLKALDTGLFVSNLWYLNYSDRQACRMTGMTRYACFWVERGELVAPVNVMRFDDDALRLFGSGLVGLTDAPEFTPNSDTYGCRQLGSVTTPAALVEGFRLTL